jgi:hypothetical protein
MYTREASHKTEGLLKHVYIFYSSFMPFFFTLVKCIRLLKIHGLYCTLRSIIMFSYSFPYARGLLSSFFSYERINIALIQCQIV